MRRGRGRRFAWAAALVATLAACAWAQAAGKPRVTLTGAGPRVTTPSTVAIGGRRIAYTATAGTLLLRDARQRPTASVFYTAYTRTGRGAAGRPITFVYNGGPGSSSAWLHLGGLGPKRVRVPDAATPKGAPFALVNNGSSILDATDLVFIDPVGTGFSHRLNGASGKQFWGVDEDVRAMGATIESYLDQYHRWNSPKFLLGESYGTFRSAALANYLQTQGVQLNGVILLSSVLNFEASSFAPGNDLPFVLFLPSYAAIAWYHHQLRPQPAHLRPLLAAVEKFAFQSYAPALLEGDRLPAAERRQLAAQLGRYTGLGASVWEQGDLRVNAVEFEQRLLAGRGLVTGRLDGRYSGVNVNPLWPARAYPVMQSSILGAFTAGIHTYLSEDLHYTSRRPYRVMNGAVARAWDWRHRTPFVNFGARPGFTDVVPDLRRAMVTNPHLRLMVNEAYYDLGTPFFATEYTLAQLKLPPALAGHVAIHHYRVGHMLYLNRATRRQLHANLEQFVRATLAAQQ
jgi:carboxypeptidase C (cathepsin A)